MSAIASAKKRRGESSQPTKNPGFSPANHLASYPPQPGYPPQQYSPYQQPQMQQQPQQQPKTGLTMQEVILVIDNRLLAIERAQTAQTTAIEQLQKFMAATTSEPQDTARTNEINDCIEEHSSRFEVVAEELVDLKNTVFSLQTYTMNVNKVLFDQFVNKGETPLLDTTDHGTFTLN